MSRIFIGSTERSDQSIVYIDLPQVDLTIIPGENVLAGEFIWL